MSKSNRAAFLLISLLVLAGFAYLVVVKLARNDGDALPSALIGKPFPAFNLSRVDDPAKPVTLADLQGPALVNVWATWCVACKAEHPVLNELAKTGVRIYGVNYKDDNAAAQKWLKEFHNPYLLNIIDADGKLGMDLGVYGAPETFLIDKQGVIRHKFVGVIDREVWRQQLAAKYRELVDEAGQ